MTELEWEATESLIDLIAIAETHIMQTYDRAGTMRRKIDRAIEVIKKIRMAPKKEDFIL